MAIPTKWVRKNVYTGEIEIVHPPSNHAILVSGRADYQCMRFAATAELAMEVGWEDMAEAWRDYHKCPFDCTMTYCSSEKCPKASNQLVTFKAWLKENP
jgi:hypothetical protein